VGYVKRLPCKFDRTSEKYNVPFSPTFQLPARARGQPSLSQRLLSRSMLHYLPFIKVYYPGKNRSGKKRAKRFNPDEINDSKIEDLML
jgi:hypothetical protein